MSEAIGGVAPAHRGHLGNGRKHQHISKPNKQVAPDQTCGATVQKSEDAGPVCSLAHPSMGRFGRLIHQGNLPSAHQRASKTQSGDEAKVALEACQ